MQFACRAFSDLVFFGGGPNFIPRQGAGPGLALRFPRLGYIDRDKCLKIENARHARCMSRVFDLVFFRSEKILFPGGHQTRACIRLPRLWCLARDNFFSEQNFIPGRASDPGLRYVCLGSDA
jgi:hypothetical protein